MSVDPSPIPFALPSFDEKEEEAVLRVMRSRWLTTGPEAKAFEEEFAAFTGAEEAVSVNSATAGLHLALEALGVKAGDVVITSPYTFAATAEVARYLGAEVRFADTAPGSYNVSPDAVEAIAASEPRAKAIIAVHVGGLPCDMAALRGIAKRHGLALVEDAAHAFPSRTKAGFAGTLGDIGVYSFYATKTISTGEGGMAVTNDPALATRMRVMRLHGIDRDVFNRYRDQKASWKYAIVEPGYKYNMTDLAAAIGRVQLKKADSFLAERERIAGMYDIAFSGNAGLVIPPKGEGHAWHLYSLRICEGVNPGSDQTESRRDALARFLQGRGVGISVHFIPLHTMPYWSARYSLKPEDFPNALAMYRATLSLPIYPGLSDESVSRVIQAVRDGIMEPGIALSGNDHG